MSVQYKQLYGVQGLTTSANATDARHDADVAPSRLQVHAYNEGLTKHSRWAGGAVSHNAGQQSGDNALQALPRHPMS